LFVLSPEGKVTGGHLADFHQSLLDRGGTAKNALMKRAQVLRVLQDCKAERIAELQPARVQRALKALHDDEDLSLRTCNHYLRSVKQFTRWLHRERRAREDGLQHLAGFNAKLDRRYRRRVLSEDGLQRFIAAAEAGPAVCGMDGPTRAMLYRVACGTGFRASELGSLTPESFDLDADLPAVVCAAAYSKHRREDRQLIPEALADLLRPWLADKPEGKPVFRMPDKPVKLVKADLAAARAAWIAEAASPRERERREDGEFLRYRDGAGDVFDFHSLRAVYISAVVKSGASVKVCMELARHGSADLTMRTYAKLTAHDVAGAVEAVPVIGKPSPSTGRAAATGTYDARPEKPAEAPSRRAAHAQRAGATSGNIVKQAGPRNPERNIDANPLTGRGKAVIMGPSESPAPVAQLDRASVYGTEGCRFESCRACSM